MECVDPLEIILWICNSATLVKTVNICHGLANPVRQDRQLLVYLWEWLNSLGELLLLLVWDSMELLEVFSERNKWLLTTCSPGGFIKNKA